MTTERIDALEQRARDLRNRLRTADWQERRELGRQIDEIRREIAKLRGEIRRDRGGFWASLQWILDKVKLINDLIDQIRKLVRNIRYLLGLWKQLFKKLPCKVTVIVGVTGVVVASVVAGVSAADIGPFGESTPTSVPPTVTAPASPTPTPTVTPRATPAPTETPEPTVRPSPTLTLTPSPTVTPTPEALRIGVLVPSTGVLSDFGRDYVNTANLALDHINAAGGVLGQPVELVIGDTGTAPEQGVAEARRLVDIAGVHAIVGAASSGVSLAVAESVTIPNKIIQISNASTSPALTDVADNDYLFRTPISDAAQGVVLADLVEDLGFTSVCTLYVNNAYGQGLSENFAAAYTGEVTAQVSHTSETATTYASELSQCVEGDPEALLALSYPTGQADVYLKEAIEGAIIDQFVFCDGTKSGDMFAKLGWEPFDGMQGTAPGALQTEFGTTFDDAFEAKHGYLYQTPFNREAYDAVIVIALAAEKAGSTESRAIRDALRDIANPPGEMVAPGVGGYMEALELIARDVDINYWGAAGPIDFDDNGDVLQGAIEIWQIREGEIVEAVRTFEVDLSTKPPTVEVTQ